MNTRNEHLWVGIDVGKGHHWAVAINSAGEAVFSRKIPNDETEILKLIATACEALRARPAHHLRPGPEREPGR